jgi:hypothetical protein
MISTLSFDERLNMKRLDINPEYTGEIADYLLRHRDLFKDPHFHQLVDNEEPQVALDYAQEHMLAIKVVGDHKIELNYDAVRFGSFVSWVASRCAYRSADAA